MLSLFLRDYGRARACAVVRVRRQSKRMRKEEEKMMEEKSEGV
jgi:hypothetical protein